MFLPRNMNTGPSSIPAARTRKRPLRTSVRLWDPRQVKSHWMSPAWGIGDGLISRKTMGVSAVVWTSQRRAVWHGTLQALKYARIKSVGASRNYSDLLCGFVLWIDQD